MFRIDAHQSFTAQHPPGHFGPILARNRFAGSVCIVEPDTPLAVADFPFVLAAVVRQFPGASQAWLSHPKFRGVLWDAETLRANPALPATRLDLMVSAADLPAVLRFSESRPGVSIVLDHLAGPSLASPDEFPLWTQVIEQLAALPHVHCKLSGLVRLSAAPWHAAALRPYVHHALRCFGPQRLMFGSGWPHCLPEYGWKETLAAFTQSLGAAPIDLREQLLGATAARFYAISEPPAAVL